METIFTVILFILILFYINTILKEKYFNQEEDILGQQQIKINMDNYQKFLKQREEIDSLLKDYNEINDSNIEFGYSNLKETDKETLGFCPLGEYYKTQNIKFKPEPEHLAQCKECQNCQEKPGWYLGGGCLGDRDSNCQFGKLPLDLYLKGHSKYSLFHNALPQHTHDYKLNNKTTTSSINHHH